MLKGSCLQRSVVVLTYFGIAGFVLLAAFAVFVATRPDNFRIERGAQIDAPSDVVFTLINDLHQWQRWSPFEKLDPDMEKTFSGPTSGPGAVYAWSGNNKAGEGRMTLLESKPGEFVAMRLDFVKPFACTNQVGSSLTPSETGTRVSWVMEGKNNFMGKAFSVFMNMDKMVGKEFEEGLANLNAAAQAEKSEGALLTPAR